jgi:hypothetical protein
MFFKDWKKRKIPEGILRLKQALSNFKIENDGYLYDTNSIIFLTGASFSKSYIHYIIILLIYYIIGLHYSIFFFLIMYDWSWRYTWYHIAEELLSLEFYDYNDEFNFEKIGGYKSLDWRLIYAYNHLGYIIFGLHNYTELFTNALEYDKMKNWIGYYNNYVNLNKIYFKKKIRLTSIKKKKIYKLNKEKIKNLSYIKFIYFYYKDIKKLYLYNKKIIIFLYNMKIRKKNNYNYFFLYNKDRGFYWHKINELYKKDNIVSYTIKKSKTKKK